MVVEHKKAVRSHGNVDFGLVLALLRRGPVFENAFDFLVDLRLPMWPVLCRIGRGWLDGVVTPPAFHECYVLGVVVGLEEVVHRGYFDGGFEIERARWDEDC